MTVGLLDVNVLIALLDPDHISHGVADSWFADHSADGWATCPITENGFVRVVGQPGYRNPVPSAVAIQALAAARDVGEHVFWPCDVSLLDGSLIDAGRVHGPRQVTDVSLLALAVAHSGRLVTFDRSIALSAVHGAGTERILVLG